MANAAALIHEGLWKKDRDFRHMSRLAQCTYLQLLSQKDLDCAGVLTLHLDYLAKGCEELTNDQLRTDLDELEDRRFVYTDYDTDELIIRSYMRLVSVKSPNAWKSAQKSVLLVASNKIQQVMAIELRRIGRRDAIELANRIDPSEPPLDPIRTPFEGDIPSESHSKPPRSVPVVGNLTSPITNLGGNPPTKFCPKHPNGSDAPCWACKLRREHAEAYEVEQERLESEAASERRRRELACPICQGTNWIPNTDPAVRCSHEAAVNA